jgi:hypothetical protein
MSIKRLSELDREYRVISRQIDASDNAADLAGLKKLRKAIVTEAREIIRKLNLPAPTWTRKKT